jgi:hypothetical protein
MKTMPVRHIIKCLLLLVLLAAGAACVKKVDLRLGDQAREYPVIFGILSDDPSDNTVTVSLSESFSGKNSGRVPEISLKVESWLGGETFQKTGDRTYSLTTPILPFIAYKFTCIINEAEYELETTTPLPIWMDSVRLIRQPDGNMKIGASLLSFGFVNFILAQVKIGDIRGTGQNADTLWQTYNERFPEATDKVRFFSPLMVYSDTMGRASFDIIPNCSLPPGVLVRVELYAIDINAAAYLEKLQSTEATVFDPVSISPPLTEYMFSNKGLGIIVTAVKSSKVRLVP